MEYFPVIKTSRLLLRKIEPEDFPKLIEYAGNKKISDKILSIPYPFREPDAAFRMSGIVRGFKSNTRFVFSIILKDRKHLIGEVGLNIETPNTAQLSYWIGEPFWSNGYATEAAEAALKWGFEKLNPEKIFASGHLSNPASKSVLQKIGMKEKNTTGNLIHFELRKSDFFKMILVRGSNL